MKYAGLALTLLAPPVLAQDDPEYLLGRLGLPPVTEPADPLRLVDLGLGFAEDGSTVTSFEGRLKLGARAFFGGEVRDERLGAFFDTQRIELGVSEDDGRWNFEGAYRASFFRVGMDAEKRRDDTWNLLGDGSLRLSSDLELLLRYQHDTDDSRGGPPSLEEFIETSRLPATGRPTRTLRSGVVGFLYQRETHFELAGEASASRVRTEAGFDQTRSRAGASVLWNLTELELDGKVAFDRMTGRLARTEGLAELGVAVRFGGRHFVATGRTLQEWQPGVERFRREHRGGVTFYARSFNFARASEIGDKVLGLARRANELGYNERRVYDTDELRAFRERLSLSSARRELAEAINALYLAQVREESVPQLGFEISTTDDEIAGSETNAYRMFVGVPWRLALPFTRGDDRVDFLRLDWVLRDQRFPSVDWSVRSHELTVTAELTRQHILRFQWEKPGQTPQQLAFRMRPGTRIRAELVYALGR